MGSVKVELTEEAEADMQEIAVYSLLTWGEVQAADYVEGLTVAMHALVHFGQLGRHDPDLGVRRWRHERHVIFYRIETYASKAQVVLVVRILHEKQMPPRVL